MVIKMKKIMRNLYKIVGILTLLALFSCQTADELIPTTGNEVTGIRIMLPNGTNTDFAVIPDENNIINLDIDGSIKTDLAKIRMSVSIPNNATVESAIPLGEYMDFSKPVSFDVIGADGAKKTYTVKLKVIPSAIGIKELWKKTGSEMGFTTHNNGAVGISGNYIIVHSRTGFSYFNLADGGKAGDMSWEGIDWQDLGFKLPLHMTTDDAGNIASCNAAVAGGQEVHMFWWKGVTAKPELLFKYTLESLPKAQIGRKIYVRGDLTKHAFVYLAVSNNNVILQWEVKDGKVVSETPKKIEFNIDYTMGVQAKVVPIGMGENSNYFINRFVNNQPQVAITYMDGKTNKPIYESEHHIQNVFHQWLGGGHAFDYADMNGARYIFLLEQNTHSWMREIFTVRAMMKDPSKIKDITSLIHTRVWNDWLYFPLDPAFGENGNATGEVKVCVAPDGYSATVAFLCTNSGIIVWNVSLE
ncbi:hypothetical protein DSECCO2_287880 [anaerobic digester metagenome]|jgi:hypothetical protein